MARLGVNRCHAVLRCRDDGVLDHLKKQDEAITSVLFGVTPSIAIATLLIALFKQGPLYAATESRSMILGAAALARLVTY